MSIRSHRMYCGFHKAIVRLDVLEGRKDGGIDCAFRTKELRRTPNTEMQPRIDTANECKCNNECKKDGEEGVGREA